MKQAKTNSQKQDNAGQLETLPRGATVSPTRFVILSLVTLGMYHTYWAWRMWEVARRSEDETFKFTSSLRGIFLLFSGFALFPRMHALAKTKGYDENAEPVLIAIFYLLAGVGSDVLSSILGQSEVALSTFVGILVSSLVLLPAVTMQNQYAEATKGTFTPSKPNWWLIVFLAISFFFTFAVFNSGV